MSSYVNPLADVDANDATGTVKKPTKILTESNKNTTLSRWFVSNQKTEEWDKKKLNQLHIAIVLLLVIIYVCHVVASPFLQFIRRNCYYNYQDTWKFMFNSCHCMFNNNVLRQWKLGGYKMIFDKGNVRTYIYGFWIVRSFIIEIVKGQIFTVLSTCFTVFWSILPICGTCAIKKRWLSTCCCFYQLLRMSFLFPSHICTSETWMDVYEYKNNSK